MKSLEKQLEDAKADILEESKEKGNLQKLKKKLEEQLLETKNTLNEERQSKDGAVGLGNRLQRQIDDLEGQLSAEHKKNSDWEKVTKDLKVSYFFFLIPRSKFWYQLFF